MYFLGENSSAYEAGRSAGLVMIPAILLALLLVGVLIMFQLRRLKKAYKNDERYQEIYLKSRLRGLTVFFLMIVIPALLISVVYLLLMIINKIYTPNLGVLGVNWILISVGIAEIVEYSNIRKFDREM